MLTLLDTLTNTDIQLVTSLMQDPVSFQKVAILCE